MVSISYDVATLRRSVCGAAPDAFRAGLPMRGSHGDAAAPAAKSTSCCCKLPFLHKAMHLRRESGCRAPAGCMHVAPSGAGRLTSLQATTRTCWV